jgi:hypothetical protein
MTNGPDGADRIEVDDEGRRIIRIGSVAEFRGLLASLGIDVDRSPDALGAPTKTTLDPQYLRSNDGPDL